MEGLYVIFTGGVVAHFPNSRFELDPGKVRIRQYEKRDEYYHLSDISVFPEDLIKHIYIKAESEDKK